MKENFFSDILLYWNKLSLQQKKNALQDFEIMNSILDDRQAREVVISKIDNENVLGQYRHEEPSLLYVNKELMGYVSGGQFADTVRHEGFHALMHDFADGRANLTVIGDISKQKVVEGKVTDSVASAMLPESFVLGCHVLQAISYEERLVRRQTALYVLYNLLNMCENIEDTLVVFKDYKALFLDLCDYNKIIAKCDLNALEKFNQIKTKVETYFNEKALATVLDETLQTIEVATKDKNEVCKIKVNEGSLISFYKTKLQSSKDVVKTKFLSEQQIGFLTDFFDYNLNTFVEIQNMNFRNPKRDLALEQFKKDFQTAALSFDLEK